MSEQIRAIANSADLSNWKEMRTVVNDIGNLALEHDLVDVWMRLADIDTENYEQLYSALTDLGAARMHWGF
jgi:hypothetical protein